MEAGIMLENNPVDSHPADRKTAYHADISVNHPPTVHR